MRRTDTLHFPFARKEVLDSGTKVANWPKSTGFVIAPRTSDERISLGTHFDLGVTALGQTFGAIARVTDLDESLVQIVGKSNVVESATLHFELIETDDLTIIRYDFELLVKNLPKIVRRAVTSKIDSELPSFALAFQANVHADCQARAA